MHHAQRRHLLIGLIIGSVMAATAAAVWASPQELQSLKKSYPAKASEFSCKTCHESAAGSAKNLNYYGRAMQKFMAAVSIKAMTPEHFKRMEEYDDDGDGVYNGDELKAGTNPGDPASKPGAEPAPAQVQEPPVTSSTEPQQPESAAIPVPEPAPVAATEPEAPAIIEAPAIEAPPAAASEQQPVATQPAKVKDKKKSRRW
ncbi:MAG: hypothetical protein HY737_04495 [Candidatus Omnitrophica bacterium]|nr:hypothetical protein [Candidatus Omnitrophota bacterium]